MNDFFDYWFGDTASYYVMRSYMDKIDGATIEQRAGWSSHEEEEEDDKYQGYGYMIQEVGSVAVVNIKGQLISQSNWLTRMFGMTGYDEIRNAMAAVVQAGDATGIMLDIDSPGGATAGLNDTSAMVKQVDAQYLPVISHTGGVMASAAFRIGAAAREIYATSASEVGSIGVVAVHQEMSKMLTERGITTNVFRSGKYKMLGNSVEKLSPLAEQVIQDKVDYLAEDFVQEVAENLGLPVDYVRENLGEGRVFFGEQAASVGLISGIESYEGVVKRLDDIHNSATGGSPLPQPKGI